MALLDRPPVAVHADVNVEGNVKGAGRGDGRAMRRRPGSNDGGAAV
jgi:hypothetical protein